MGSEAGEFFDPLLPVVKPGGEARREGFRGSDGRFYDVAVFGGGISGARIYHELCRKGYRALIIDRGDFACGTSQASGMMIWGGLLYLKDFDIFTVRRLCRERDRLMEQMPEKIRRLGLRYLPVGLRSRHLVRAGMVLYWLLGSRGRRFPGVESKYEELQILRAKPFRSSLTVEEAMLRESDCRFALDWILANGGSSNSAFNHCVAEEIRYEKVEGNWHLTLRDRVQGGSAEVRAKFIVNAAGAWTDELNGRLGVDSPYRHEISKGVYISFRRPEALRKTLIFDTGTNGDTLTFAPWGPVALCGPTETELGDIGEGFRVKPEDVRILLDLANQNLNAAYGAEDVISMRCGVRALGVRRGFSKKVHSLKLSRKHLVHHDREKNVIAVYGGKLTSCGLLAEQVSGLIAPHLSSGSPPPIHLLGEQQMDRFSNLDPVPSAVWCRDNEHCHTLEDYLRRRTNISQWVARRGLGKRSEHLGTLREIARVFSSDEKVAEQMVFSYEKDVENSHDSVLSAV